VFNAQQTFGYYLAVLALLFLAVMHRFITARFRPSNWLVRMSELGLFIQFRSYLNFHLPAEDLTVVFVPYSEIRSARLIREHSRVPASRGHTATQTLRYVEFELASDTAALAKALDAELAERAPKEFRAPPELFAGTGSLHNHCGPDRDVTGLFPAPIPESRRTAEKSTRADSEGRDHSGYLHRSQIVRMWIE
jgi:hypothetical protein